MIPDCAALGRRMMRGATGNVHCGLTLIEHSPQSELGAGLDA